MDAKLDIILFGVTGLVGRYAIKHLQKLCSENAGNLKWGVAGRNIEKIRKILNETIQENAWYIPIIIADMDDQISIRQMTRKTRLILNACGPLRNKGEVVIDACLKSNTHYIDVSAEPNFIEKIQLEYNELARESGIYIVNTCGVDTLAYDMGVVFLRNIFEDSTLNSVESYYRVGFKDHSIPGPQFNNSTWKSAIDLTANSHELKEMRRKQKTKLPKLEPKLKTRWLPFKSDLEEGWIIPSITADLSVMKRTQQYIHEIKKQRPVQLMNYIVCVNLIELIVVSMSLFTFAVLCQFDFGRKMLLKHPALFSGGLFGFEEPRKEKIDSSWLRLTFVGKGWDKNNAQKEVTIRISANNPAYDATSLCLVLSGITLLKETSRLPENFGVYTPGAAFCDTTIIDRLQENDVEFKILE